MNELRGCTAIVTGASRGIGAAAARALAAEGATVIVSDLADTTAIAAEIGGLAYRQDVTQESDWEEIMAFTARETGGLDILVNNAGVFLMKPVGAISLDDWRRVHAVNVEGVFLGCKHALPLLAARASSRPGGAAIVNLSSVAGLTGSSGGSCYSASKGAVRLLTKSLAIEFAPLKVRVNSVHPGVIETDMGGEVISRISEGRGIGQNEARVMTAGLHPIGRMGVAEDIAAAIIFLASDRSGFMTGSELVVDGGLTAQ